jgi:hypothetical protein
VNGGKPGWTKILRSFTNTRKDASKNLKNSFAKVGAYSSEENFIRGNSEGVIEWISGEVEAFEEF